MLCLQTLSKFQQGPSYQGWVSNKDPLIKDGFNDWKNAHSRLAAHERSECHTTSIKNAHENAKSRRIDVSIAYQLQMEQRYWREVLKRLVAVIKHLSSRGLAFRDDIDILGDTHNGNYLGSIELIAEFDPFLQIHIVIVNLIRINLCVINQS